MNSGLNSDNPTAGGRVPQCPAAPGHPRAGRLRGAGGGLDRDPGMAAAAAVAAAARGQRGSRASRAPAAADRLRHPVDLRRSAAGAAGHGRPGCPRRSSSRPRPAPRAGSSSIVNWAGTSWSYHPIQARRLGGLDSDRDRRLADHRAPWPVVQARRAGQRRVGPGGLGVRRGLRRYLRARPDLALRRTGRGGVLLRRRRADRGARAQLAGTAAGPDGAVGPGTVLPRHGRAAGVAGPRLLAGNAAGQQRARSPAWSGPWRRLRSRRCWPGGSAASRPSPQRTDSRSTCSCRRAGGHRHRPADRGRRAAGAAPPHGPGLRSGSASRTGC